MFRTLLDKHGNEIKSDLLLDPVVPLALLPARDTNSIDESAAAPGMPTIASYIDKPWRMTSAQFKDIMRLISNKSRSVHQIPFTNAENEEYRSIWNDILADSGENTHS